MKAELSQESCRMGICRRETKRPGAEVLRWVEGGIEQAAKEPEVQAQKKRTDR